MTVTFDDRINRIKSDLATTADVRPLGRRFVSIASANSLWRARVRGLALILNCSPPNDAFIAISWRDNDRSRAHR